MRAFGTRTAERPPGCSPVQVRARRRLTARPCRPLPSQPVPAPRRLVPALVAVVTLAACATGPRPHLTEEAAALGGAPRTPSGDAGADRVLSLLESVADGPFTATYHVTRKLGPNETNATVVQDGSQLAVTVGDVRFLHTKQDATCVLS